MIEKTQAALARAGVDDTVEAAGVFLPRGHFGGAIAGGMIGDSLLGDGLAGAVGGAAGVIAGAHLVDANSPMPERCFVCVTASRVYGFDSEREHGRVPTDLVFAVDRDELEVKVHQRVNVRVLELLDSKTGAAIELEGPRLPGFHAGSVFEVLHDH